MLLLTIIFLVSSSAVAFRRDKSILYARSVIISILTCAFLGLNSFYFDFQDKGLGLFHGFFHITTITYFFHIFIFIISTIILQLNCFFPRKISTPDFSSLYEIIFCKLIYFNSFIINKMAEQFRILEYPLIILFVITGGIFLVSSCDLISIFLAIELQSYGLYILCTVYKDSEKSTSAGLTYFLLGGLSSCFILLASSLFYANSGNTSFDGLYIINNIYNIYVDFIHDMQQSWYQSYYINFSLIIMSVGFLFKMAAAPFHFWSPDVYDAIPTIVTTFVAVFAKISILILLLELVYYTTNLFQNDVQSESSLVNISWTFTLLLSSLLSLIIGSVLGLTQFRVKRLYAYSTISHIGFILLALSINSIESIQSFIFYLIQYSLSNLNAFVLLVTIGFSLYLYTENNKITKKADRVNASQQQPLSSKISDKNNSPLQLINQMKGYFYINPILAVSLSLTIFSFVGIPPLLGFFAKQMVLTSALDKGYIFMALIAILTSVISAYYYLALVQQIFFYKSDYSLNPQLKNIIINGNIINRADNNLLTNMFASHINITLSNYLTITISILTLIIFLFMLNPQQWLSMANILAIVLYNC